MVGRMIREAVENIIDDVKDSIEEQGRQADRSRRVQPLGPMPGLEPPAPAPALPPVAPSASAPAVTAPAVAAEAVAAEVAVPENGADDPEHEGAPAPGVVDEAEDPERPTELPAGSGPQSDATISQLEDDVEAARELYRETRDELRQARRDARLIARDERRDRRHARRSRSRAGHRA